jgi:hypothetical protein
MSAADTPDAVEIIGIASQVPTGYRDVTLCQARGMMAG